MERYGSDKPDTRFAMEILDLTEAVRGCGFGVFDSAVEGGGTVRAITAKNAVSTLTRKEVDKLTEFVRGIGTKGLAWVRWTADGVASSFGKFLTEEAMQALLSAAQAEPATWCSSWRTRLRSMSSPPWAPCGWRWPDRLQLPREGFHLLWITEMPFFEWDEELGQYVAMHHPFTAPMDECIPYLDSKPDKVFAKAYDLVLNGIELASGSIRITDPELQGRMFRALGLSEEDAQAKFGFLLNAFQYGAPASRRHGAGAGPVGDADAGRPQSAGCGSLPQGAEHDRADDGMPRAGGRSAAQGAGDRRGPADNGIKRTAAESRRRFCINAYIYSLLYKPRSAAPLRFCKGNQKERTVSMEKLTFTPVRTPETIAQVAALAEEIWTEHYASILPAEQIRYMVDSFQSAGAIEKQLAHQHYRYYLVKADGEAAATSGVQPEKGRLFLSKLYLRKAARAGATPAGYWPFCPDSAAGRDCPPSG